MDLDRATVNRISGERSARMHGERLMMAARSFTWTGSGVNDDAEEDYHMVRSTMPFEASQLKKTKLGRRGMRNLSNKHQGFQMHIPRKATILMQEPSRWHTINGEENGRKKEIK